MQLKGFQNISLEAFPIPAWLSWGLICSKTTVPSPLRPGLPPEGATSKESSRMQGWALWSHGIATQKNKTSPFADTGTVRRQEALRSPFPPRPLWPRFLVASFPAFCCAYVRGPWPSHSEFLLKPADSLGEYLSCCLFTIWWGWLLTMSSHQCQGTHTFQSPSTCGCPPGPASALFYLTLHARSLREDGSQGMNGYLPADDPKPHLQLKSSKPQIPNVGMTETENTLIQQGCTEGREHSLLTKPGKGLPKGQGYEHRDKSTNKED